MALRKSKTDPLGWHSRWRCSRSFEVCEYPTPKVDMAHQAMRLREAECFVNGQVQQVPERHPADSGV
jgi:hypothetical protein